MSYDQDCYDEVYEDNISMGYDEDSADEDALWN
jgi:hypothetical protein